MNPRCVEQIPIALLATQYPSPTDLVELITHAIRSEIFAAISCLSTTSMTLLILGQLLSGRPSIKTHWLLLISSKITASSLPLLTEPQSGREMPPSQHGRRLARFRRIPSDYRRNTLTQPWSSDSPKRPCSPAGFREVLALPFSFNAD
jgi:hypothetical protein